MFKRMIPPVLLLAFATDDSARKPEPPTHGLATPYTKTETIPSVDTQTSMPIVRKDQRVVTALDSKNLNYQFLQEGKIFRVGFNLANHRHHFGMIASFHEKLNPIDPYTPSIRRIWAIAYSDPKLPSAETLAGLMIESGKRKIGAWEMFRESQMAITLSCMTLKHTPIVPPTHFFRSWQASPTLPIWLSSSLKS